MGQIENVTFVLIARNEAYGVEKALNALEILDFKSCEVICVDSGSSDGTLNVMSKFKRRIPHLQIVSIKGYSNAAIARNVGLARAKQEFIFFLLMGMSK